MTQLQRGVPPNLPLAPDQFGKQYQDQLNNVLRLYFNRINESLNAVSGPAGGQYINSPYAAIQRSTNLTLAANTATQVTFDQNDYLNGCANDGTDGIRVSYSGIYNYQFSVQLKNTDTQIHVAWIWLRVNNVDVPGTGSKFDIGGKHGSLDGFLIAACNFYVALNAGDTVEMWAAVNNSLVTFDAVAAQTTPFAMPAVPSVVATLTFVSEN